MCQREPKNCYVIDSAKAKKALACVEAIAKIADEYLTTENMSREDCAAIGKLLKQHGFIR